MKLSARMSSIFERAISLANDNGHGSVDTVHLLVALLEERDTLTHAVLRNLGVDLWSMRDQARRTLNDRPFVRIEGSLHLTMPARWALANAAGLAASQVPQRDLDDEYLFLGLASVEGSTAYGVINDHDLSFDVIKQELNSIIMPA